MKAQKPLAILIRCLLSAIFIYLFSSSPVAALDVPEWRGPGRTGVYQETNLLKKWPKAGPNMLWKKNGVGDGYSHVAVVKGRVYITGVKSGKEYLTAFDTSGKILWTTRYGKGTSNTYHGARTTPTVMDGKVYVISGSGEIVCIDAVTGTVLWSVNGLKTFDGDEPFWGIAESPLVFEGKVIYTPGGSKTSIVALDMNNGKTVWQSPSLKDDSAYVSPILVKYGNVRQIITVLATYIIGVDPNDGNIMWKVDYEDAGDFTMRSSLNTITPIFRDGMVFVTSGYDQGGVMVKISKGGKSAKVLWKSEYLDTHHGGVVLVDNNLCGSNWISNKRGNWVCLDWNTGKKILENRWGGKGSIIYADGLFYLYEELRGNIGIAKIRDNRLYIASSMRIRLGNDQHWSHPVISDGRLYLRRGDVLMVFDIRAGAGKTKKTQKAKKP